MHGGRASQFGFTYIGVLMTVAAFGVVLAGAGQLWSLNAKRERERELLFVGDQFRVAIESYVAATPPGKPRYPLRLEDLLDDRRHINVRRHLRQIYPDPFTGVADWETTTAPDGGIAGLHSRHDGKPIKIAGFPPAYRAFERAETYRDWTFAVAMPRAPLIQR
jgi:type II secretory pathway pseudopilin PulG